MDYGFDSASVYLLIRVAGVLLLFLPCVWLAVRRSRNAAPGSRGLGIFLAALAPMAGYPLYFGALSVIVTPVLLVYVAIFVVAWLAVPAVISAVVADVVLRLLGATRTAIWLALGIAAALAMSLFWFAWYFGGPPPMVAGLLPDYALVTLVPASSALLWWSHLPPEPDDVTSAFD